MGRQILMVAGEASGDLHGAHLAMALQRRVPDLVIRGVGGERMRAAGVEILHGIEELGVVGFFEVLSHLKVIGRVYWMLRRLLARGEVDLLILIDYPGFNLRLARVAKHLGIVVLYYISPQVWAWRQGRLKTIRRLVDQMMVILPFEEGLYAKAGIPCRFVGHPLLDEIPVEFDREAFCSRHGLDPAQPILGLLPGSRRKEVAALMPVLLESLPRIRERVPNLQCLLAVAPSLPIEWFDTWCSDPSLGIHRIRGETTEILRASDGVVTASGTATLQAAICGTPMVIIYRLAPLTYLLGRLLVRINHIGLVNVVAGRGVVPEFIQGAVTPERIVESISPILLEPDLRDRIRKELAGVRERLGAPGASERAASSVLEHLNGATAAIVRE
jgi:lipid-A-disaccharide synthase